MLLMEGGWEQCPSNDSERENLIIRTDQELPPEIEEAIDNKVKCFKMRDSALKEAAEYSLSIPRAYAREETNNHPGDPESVDHFELYVSDQPGSWNVRRQTNVYLRLPKSGILAPICIYPNSARGVEFAKTHHRLVMRELDKKDRHIVLGFCRKYATSLIDACHGRGSEYETKLKTDAKFYRNSDQPKRFKLGNSGLDRSSNMFDNVGLLL